MMEVKKKKKKKAIKTGNQLDGKHHQRGDAHGGRTVGADATCRGSYVIQLSN